MADITWLAFFFFHLGFINCYENLCIRTTTNLSQSSTYNNNTADLANDGKKQTTEVYCAHTAPNHSKAWFQVNLRKPYSIERVQIYYRYEASLKHMEEELVKLQQEISMLNLRKLSMTIGNIINDPEKCSCQVHLSLDLMPCCVLR
uniref:F5/8 type C domain-containing protein n=1 Tax=Magallana gigas TaxID=29159 RepID=A0A8W8P228_MAGGI